MTHPRRSILFVIDLEPDERKTDRGDEGWGASNQALAALEDLRNRLEERTRARVRFNWFLRTDPQIQQTWGRAESVADACPEIWKPSPSMTTTAASTRICGVGTVDAPPGSTI